MHYFSQGCFRPKILKEDKEKLTVQEYHHLKITKSLISVQETAFKTHQRALNYKVTKLQGTIKYLKFISFVRFFFFFNNNKSEINPLGFVGSAL